MNKIKLSETELDFIRELGNIGTGNAVTALSQLFNKEINMSLTSLNITEFWQIAELFGDVLREYFVIEIDVNGENELTILQIFEKEGILNLINTYLENNEYSIEQFNSIDQLDDFSQNYILELANISSGHYISAVADLLSIKLLPQVPQLAYDNINSVMNSIIAKRLITQEENSIIVIENMLEIGSISLNNFIGLIPSHCTIKNFLNVAKAKYNL